MNANILMVDDDRESAEQLAQALTAHGYATTTAERDSEALALVGEHEFDLMIVDADVPDAGGLALASAVLAVRPGLPFVVVTASPTLEAVTGALRAGAYDFLPKPLELSFLVAIVTRALQQKSLRDEVKRLRTAAAHDPSKGLVGRSSVMRRMFDMIARVAPSDASVLIHGDTGTGKEVVARAIHDASGRTGRFVGINCAAVPASLLESELFGHARGAFTDAKVQRTGLFAEATHGTIFLDEIGELPLEMQPKLLRALQERTVRPIGANTEIPFDARLVCATNRDLAVEVHEKRFREDLYYRINVVNVDLPALHDRSGDVLDLAQFFLAKFATRSAKGVVSLSADAAAHLTAYDWPGNVRELENCIERAVALARFDQVTVDDLPINVRSTTGTPLAAPASQVREILTVDELERRYIVNALSLVGGNKTRAAHLLGLDRRTLYRKLERYDTTKRVALEARELSHA